MLISLLTWASNCTWTAWHWNCRWCGAYRVSIDCAFIKMFVGALAVHGTNSAFTWSKSCCKNTCGVWNMIIILSYYAECYHLTGILTVTKLLAGNRSVTHIKVTYWWPLTTIANFKPSFILIRSTLQTYTTIWWTSWGSCCQWVASDSSWSVVIGAWIDTRRGGSITAASQLGQSATIAAVPSSVVSGVYCTEVATTVGVVCC